MLTVSIAYADDSLREAAHRLSEKFNLPMDNQAKNQLLLTPERLVLNIPPFLPLFVDFTKQKWQRRRDEGKKQGLVRACKPKVGLKILDATAGWGRDAAILASFGAEVCMLEREPVMAALVEDALAHCQTPFLLSLVHCQAIDYLTALSPDACPDVIYLDPMHPVRGKTALVKKELQVLQQLIGCDKDALALLKVALTKATQRVVVKWPHHAQALLPPTVSIEGQTVRFDIYQR